LLSFGLERANDCFWQHRSSTARELDVSRITGSCRKAKPSVEFEITQNASSAAPASGEQEL
jgi:hypothetical protein